MNIIGILKMPTVFFLLFYGGVQACNTLPFTKSKNLNSEENILWKLAQQENSTLYAENTTYIVHIKP